MPELKTDKLLNDTVNEVVKDKPTVTMRIEDLVNAVSKKFIENKLDMFPYYCEVFRVQNQIKRDNIAKDGTKGYSDKKDFKWDYDIPTDLYYFMTNLVFRNFWEEDNEKVWRRFLDSIMKGDDPMTVLMNVKKIYGSSAEAKKVGII